MKMKFSNEKKPKKEKIVKFIPFRGTRVIEGWPEKLLNNQRLTVLYLEKGPDKLKRLRHDQDLICHDCTCIKNELHTLGCDMERCPKCKNQLISCDCFSNEDIEKSIEMAGFKENEI